MNKIRFFLIVFLLLAGSRIALTADKAVPARGSADKIAIFNDSIDALKKHITGEKELSNKEIESHTKIINENKKALTSSPDTVKKAMDFVETFDEKKGPLWLKHPVFSRKKKNKKPEDAMLWAVFWVMQNIFDELYTAENLERYEKEIEGFKFGSADHFPGKVEAPVEEINTVKINASYPKTWGAPVFHHDRPARKPTGSYLIPGTIATVIVPESLVDKGYQIRVGAHSWDHSRKPNVKRLYRVSAVYDIKNTETKIANPLGGGIYIEVPYEADAGIVEVKVKNAARSPYFSMKPFHKTTLKEWREVERNRKAPWADFQSEKFMMQVPTSWVYKLDDPKALMEEWDKSMDVINKLMGRPTEFGRETMYAQVDTQLRGRAFHPGYPSGNRGYDPMKDYGGNSKNLLIQGPATAHSYFFHEQGHAFLFQKFKGDREAAVNLPHVAVMNQLYGMDFNEAFRSSRSIFNPFCTLENTAITWMLSFNFQEGKPIKGYEKQYQPKGHAKLVDVARLFGWKALSKFWRSYHEEYEKGKTCPRDIDPGPYVLRMSKTIGVDLRPLMHFWGEVGVNNEETAAAIKEAGIPPSQKIYDLLIKYKKSIPKNNKEFREFTTKWWEKQPREKGFTTQRNHAAQWDSYNEKTAALLHKRVQEILDLYFPDGRPEKPVELNF